MAPEPLEQRPKQPGNYPESSNKDLHKEDGTTRTQVECQQMIAMCCSSCTRKASVNKHLPFEQQSQNLDATACVLQS